jgi:hypothetical protein
MVTVSTHSPEGQSNASGLPSAVPGLSRHDQGLTERVCVPRGTGAGPEGDTGAESTRRSGPHGPVKYSAGPLPEGCEPPIS